jgi:hypothetical protein
MTDTQTYMQTHRHTDTRQKVGIHRRGGRREWAVLIPKLLTIARSLDNIKKWFRIIQKEDCNILRAISTTCLRMT